jgi:hyperosmotically inducible periplasmic protein
MSTKTARRGKSPLTEEWKMRTTNLRMLILIPLLLAGLGLACSTQRNTNDTSYKDDVQNALKQADLTDVTVNEDRDKNTITLGGTVHSDAAKRNAGDVAKSAGGGRIIANEVSVQPVGSESQAQDVASNLDDAIEKDYKAALIGKGLDKQHIRFDAKNGVLVLKGSVKSDTQRQEAQLLAQAVPNVQQVLNQIDVKR